MQNLSWGRRLAFSLCLVVVASNVLSPVTASAQQTRRAASASASGKKVRLIVGIVIDQFRYDYLTRFEDQFGEGGFKRLLNGGAVFTNANYIHTPTYTACGHATFMSGATPSMNGIIANEAVAKSAADGYTILMALSSISVLPVADRLQGRAPAYQLDQFAPVALISADPTVLVVSADGLMWDEDHFSLVLSSKGMAGGQIDIFTADGLRPLTKIVIFADAASNETGRIVYLRRPERLLLRIQGRTPNDDAAAYRIKFAGSFVAATIRSIRFATTLKSSPVVRTKMSIMRRNW